MQNNVSALTTVCTRVSGTCAKRTRMSRVRVKRDEREREREREREEKRERGKVRWRDETGRLAYNRGVDIENLSEAE